MDTQPKPALDDMEGMVHDVYTARHINDQDNQSQNDSMPCISSDEFDKFMKLLNFSNE